MLELGLIVNSKILIDLTVILSYSLGLGGHKCGIQSINFNFGMSSKEILDKFILFIKSNRLSSLTTRPTVFTSFP